jgi:hypothetical protein
MPPRLFALDHNFPQPIVDVLVGFQVDAELVRIDEIHDAMPDLDDWEVLLALANHPRRWDGLITTDRSILNQPLELSTLIQTRLTLVVAMAAGHNPVKATGLLFAYLGGICRRTDPTPSGVETQRRRARPHRAVGRARAGGAAPKPGDRGSLRRESAVRRGAPARPARRRVVGDTLADPGAKNPMNARGADRNRTGVHGFAGRCVATPPRRRGGRRRVQAAPATSDSRSLHCPLPGRLAQLGERLLDKQEVTGSSPVSPTEAPLCRVAVGFGAGEGARHRA